MTKLGGGEKLIHTNETFPLFLQLVGKERREHSPTVVVDGFSEVERSRHPLHIQILYRYHVEVVYEFTRSLVKEISSLIGNFFMAERHFPSLFSVILASEDAMTQLALFQCEFFLGKTTEVRERRNLSFGGHVKFVHGKIQTDKFLGFFLFDFLAFEREKNTDKIFTSWCFRDCHRLNRPIVGDYTMLSNGNKSNFWKSDFLSFDTD
jgi:hypothetical protein